ncbi:Golgi complex component 7-domain-containing protein [Lactarius pseudohatsudake]|nr:Golgi complex component 7-domain-containing protein [Lactarius pseudohatsudake]
MDPGDTQPDFFRSLDSDIDPVSWINNLLQNGAREPSDLSSLEKHLNNIIPALEVASEDLSLHIERLIEEISRSASRLPYDLHFMRDGALSVQVALNNLTNRSTSFSPQSSATLDRLHSLDIVKRHMESARDVLREAESWSTLESEVSSLLSEQNYEKAAEKLSEANKSMIVFQNTPEYEARRALMISLQNQLEASLSSALIAAINSHEIALCRHYYTIFGNIQRGSEFRAYYFGSRRSSLITTWQDAQLSDAGDSSVSPSATRQTSDFLTAFFADFLAVLNSERASTSAIFPDPQLTLSSFITSTFSTLQPTFTERLSALCDHHGPAVLIELIAAFQATEKFAVAADKILERTEASTPSLSPPSDGTSSEFTSKSFRRRSSHSRLSISRRMSLSSSATGALQLLGSGLDWDTEVYEPFLEYQVSYGALETKLLSSSLPDSSLQADPARGLRERTLDVFSLAEESLSRMQAFTHGYGAAALVSSLDDFLAAFIDSSRASFVSFMPASTASVVAGSGAEDLADLDYTLEDYSAIQVWLHLLESLRGVRDRLSVFESQLRGTLLQVSIAFRAQAHDPRASLPGTTRGALQLLSQSTLNSHHLHDLLDSVQLPEGRQPAQDSARLHSAPPFLVKARTALDAAASLVQTSLQGAMLSPLHKSLANYASSPLWTASSQGASRRVGGGGATSDAAVPTFSLSPSEAMQRAAEGLLNLPRLFEVYADDDVLSFSIETLPHVDSALLESLTEPTVGEPPSSIHARRASIARPLTPAFTPEAIASVWLSSLSLSLLEHVTEKVLPSIGSLTSPGAAQLSSDLGYLGNIVNAVGVESKELGRWMEVVSMDEDTGKTTALVDGSDPILVVVAKMRGWTLA